MKKIYFSILVFFSFAFGLFGQNVTSLPIPVLANEYTTVSIFFPSPIDKVIEPSVNYKFDYEKGATIGLLKARKGNPSNLTVITEEGRIYSFALQYSEKVDNYNYIINQQQAVGETKHRSTSKNTTSESVILTKGKTDNSKTGPEPKAVKKPESIKNNKTKVVVKQPKEKITVNTNEQDTINNFRGNKNTEIDTEDDWAKEGDLYDLDREEYYRIFCENNYLQRTIFKRNFRQSKKIVLKLNNILVDRDEIYFVLQVENNSQKEYNVHGLSFFFKKKGEEVQKIMAPLHKFNLQEKIDPESVNEIMYVFKRFNLKNKEEVYVVLDEKEGNRMVLLPLDNKQINSPTN